MWRVTPELRDHTDTLLRSLDRTANGGGDPAVMLMSILGGAMKALGGGAAVSSTVIVLREAMDRLEALFGEGGDATSPPPWENI
jgi:hypothetical protein